MIEANPPQVSHANDDNDRENTTTPHYKKADVVMLFLSLFVNNRRPAKNNYIFWHPCAKCEHSQLKMNLSKLVITITHLILPVNTHRAHYNQKSEQIRIPSQPVLQVTPCDVTTANQFDF